MLARQGSNVKFYSLSYESLRCPTRSSHDRLCRAQATAPAAGTAASIKELLTKRSYAPPRLIGPIEVASIQGKRYGLRATENLAVGSLLLVVPALAVAFGAAGSAPNNAELVAQLDGQLLQPWQLQWLRALHRSPIPPAAAAAQDAQQQQQQEVKAADADLVRQQHEQQEETDRQLQQLQQLLSKGEAAYSESKIPGSTQSDTTTPPAAGAAIRTKDKITVTAVSNPLTKAQLQQIVTENAYSEISEDIGASLLRELDPEAVTGLWPEYALLNHSCAPNTVAVVIGRFLILRAVTTVLAGEEFTGSYLGRLGFSPVAVRRAYLFGIYGFHCQCPRCMSEQSTFPTTYYPADNALLGIVDPNKPTPSNSNDTMMQQQQQQREGGGVLSRLLGFAGLGNRQQQQQQQLVPSAQHTLLLKLHAEAAELAAAVQEAAVADSKRQEKQLGLLYDITDRIAAAVEAIEDVEQQLQQQLERDDQIASVTQTATWLLAAVYPLLDLRVEAIELLLASGDLAVDDRFLLYDEKVTSQGPSSRRVAADGGAAARRLSFSGSGKRKRQKQGLGFQGLWDSFVSGWGLSPEAQGPMTKRQLLGLYVEGLGQCVTVADAVARGSDVHIVMALKHMDAVRQQFGADSEETRLAEGLCSRAHAARYGVMKGQEGQQLLLRLIAARRRQLLGISLARKMSVLAWESSSVRDV